MRPDLTLLKGKLATAAAQTRWANAPRLVARGWKLNAQGTWSGGHGACNGVTHGVGQRHGLAGNIAIEHPKPGVERTALITHFSCCNGVCEILKVGLLGVRAVVHDVDTVGDWATNGLPSHTTGRASVPFDHAQRLSSRQTQIEMPRRRATATSIDNGRDDGVAHVRDLHAHAAVFPVLD